MICRSSMPLEAGPQEAQDFVAGTIGRLSPGASDLDIGIKSSRRLTVQEKVEIAVVFEDLFGVPRTDVVVISEVPVSLAFRIVTGELLHAQDFRQTRRSASSTSRGWHPTDETRRRKKCTRLDPSWSLTCRRDPSMSKVYRTARPPGFREAIAALKELPLSNQQAFLGNKHNIAAAESYLRRSPEALFDVGRHILAKGFAYPATEYKEIARGLFEKAILGKDEADRPRKMAGYRNRMVHFYHDISPEELLDICLNHTAEIERLLEQMLQWLRSSKG